jgi:RNA recognition motif-containing protein
MMQSIRDSSQQDRRVYVGNLSYDVKWHHLKDFMRQGTGCVAPRQELD